LTPWTKAEAQFADADDGDADFSDW